MGCSPHWPAKVELLVRKSKSATFCTREYYLIHGATGRHRSKIGDMFPELARRPASAPLPGLVQRQLAQATPHDVRVGRRRQPTK
jgi:hypothetical protein